MKSSKFLGYSVWVVYSTIEPIVARICLFKGGQTGRLFYEWDSNLLISTRNDGLFYEGGLLLWLSHSLASDPLIM